jgi:hypothetical protein
LEVILVILTVFTIFVGFNRFVADST